MELIKKLNREQLFFYLLLAFCVALPIRVAYGSIGAIVIGAFFVLDKPENIKRKWSKIKHNRLFHLLILFFVIQIIGLSYTENFKKGFKEIQQLLPMVVLPLTILSEVITKEQIKKVLRFFKTYMLVLISGLMAYHMVVFGNPLSFEGNTLAILKVNAFYFAANIFMAIAINAFILKEKKYKSIISYIEIAVLLVFLLLLGARIVFLISILCAIIFFYNELKEIHFLKRIGLLIIILGSLSFVAYQVPDIKRKVDITIKNTDLDHNIILTKNRISNTRNSVEYRYLINYCGWNILKNNWFGVGTGDHQDALLAEYHDIEFRAGKERKFNAHNQYLSETIKFGIIGFIIFISLIIYIFKVSLVEKKLLFYAIIYISIVSLVESFLDRQHGVMFTAFFISLLYVLENEKTSTVRE